MALVMALSLATVAWGADPAPTITASSSQLDLWWHVKGAAEGTTLIVPNDGNTYNLIFRNQMSSTDSTPVTSEDYPKGLTIRGEDGAKIGLLHVTDGLDIEGLTIENIHFTHNDYYRRGGVEVDGSLINGKIIGCDFTDGATLGVSVANNVTVSGCEFTATRTTAISLNDTTGTTTVKNNTINSTAKDHALVFGGSVSGTLLVEGNTIKNTAERALRISALSADTAVTYKDNTLVNIGTDLFKMGGSGASTAVTFDGNTSDGIVWNPVDIGANSGEVVYLDPVAEVNGTTYDTVAAAIAAAGANDVIVLLDSSATIPDGYTALANGTVVPASASNAVAPVLYQWNNTTAKWDTYCIALGMDLDDLKMGADDNCLPCYLIDGKYFVETKEAAATYKLTYGAAKTVFLAPVDASDVYYSYKASVLTVVAESDAECGDYYVADAIYDEDDVYYIAYTKKGEVDGVFVAVKNGPLQILVNNKIVDVKSLTNADVPFKFHSFKGYDVVNKQYTTVKCENCPKVAKLYANATAATVGKKAPEKIGTLGWITFADYMDFGGKTSSVGSTTDKVQSAETFDAGIAMYVGMSVMAATGSAVVIGKKKD